jgi:hypothetical protein
MKKILVIIALLGCVCVFGKCRKNEENGYYSPNKPKQTEEQQRQEKMNAKKKKKKEMNKAEDYCPYKEDESNNNQK